MIYSKGLSFEKKSGVGVAFKSPPFGVMLDDFKLNFERKEKNVFFFPGQVRLTHCSAAAQEGREGHGELQDVRVAGKRRVRHKLLC